MAFNYSLAEVAIQFAGGPINQAGKDGALKLTKPKASFEMVEMQDGTVIFYATGSRYWEAQITCAQTAVVNDFLSAMLLKDEASARAGLGGVGLAPFGVEHIQGTSLFISPKARILGHPEVDYQSSPEDRVWKVGCADAVCFVGGSP